MLNTVRAFGKQIDPSKYRRGHGWRGWLCYVFNWLREKLERWIVLNIVRFEAMDKGYSKQEAKELVEQVESDPHAQPHLFAEPRPFKDMLQRMSQRAEHQSLKERATHRYSEGRKNREAPQRPLNIEDSALAHTLSVSKDQARGMRYLSGRRHQKQVFGEDHIEPVGCKGAPE